MTERTAYLTLPGLSVTTILLNVPWILASDDPPPVILMDVYDYNRLWEETLEDLDDNQKAPYLLMAYDSLRRQGLLHLIDYAKYYPQEEQQHYLSQNRALLKCTPAWVTQKAANRAAKGWIEYGRGEYQEPFRESLGEDASDFRALRRGEKQLRRRIKRGGGDPIAWNNKVLNKDIAALTIRRRADQVLNLNVSHVVTGSEHTITGGLLTGAGLRTDGPPSDILGIGRDTIEFDTDDFYHLDPVNNIKEITPESISQTHEVLGIVSEIAADAVDDQYTGHFILGPTLALPPYKAMPGFDFDIVKEEVRLELNPTQLATEAAQAVSVLEDRMESGLSPDRFSYQANWAAEQHNLPLDQNRNQVQGVAGMLYHATNVSNYASEIQTYLDQTDISQAAAFVALGVMSDPTRHYDEKDIYRRGINFMTKFNPSLATGLDVEETRKGRQSATWGERVDWFETVHRQR